MPEPRISVLVVARNEAHNLADCLAAARWADERVVVVDAASRDATLAIARREADVVAVRAFDDFASQRNAGAGDGHRRLGPVGRRRRADHARAGRRDPPGHRRPATRLIAATACRSGARSWAAASPSPGRSTTPAAAVPPRFGPLGRPGPRDRRAPAARPAPCSGELRHRTIPTMSAFLDKIDRYTTLEAEGLADARRPLRPGDLTLRPSGRSSSSTCSSKDFATASRGSCSACSRACRPRCGPGSTAS